MDLELTDYEIMMIKHSLEHSIRSGQFRFNMDETDELQEILNKIRAQQKEKKGISG